jgi:hypothetical protein
MASSPAAPLDCVRTRSPRMSPNIRKTFSTGLSMPLLASVPKPSKWGWSSNSKAQVSIPSRLAWLRRAISSMLLKAAAV